MQKKRGLGKGLEVLLTDTPALDGVLAHDSIEAGRGSVANDERENGLGEICQQLLQEAEALRILMLEFELIVRADLR